MSFGNKNLNSLEPIHQYLDLTLVNNDTTGTKPAQMLTFNEIRNSPIISNPSDYFLSVIRFMLETPSLPLFIPQVLLGQTDYNKTIYTITMTYKTFEYQQNIMFEPQDLSVPIPNVPLDFQDLTTAYYFIYSYTHWMKIMNDSFIACFNGLNSLVVAGGDTLPTTNAPFLEWDVNNCTAILDCDVNGYNQNGSNPINIYFNTPLYNLFSSFESNYYGYNVANGKNFLIRVYDINNTNILNLPTYNAIQMYQEYSTAPLWNPVQSLVFSTGLIPVVPSLISAPKVFGQEANLFNTGNNANIASIITDFEVALTKGNEYKPSVNYNPSSEYRLFDMNGNNPLSAVQITVFWKDKFGGLHPFYLTSGSTANIKIMFRKKEYNISAPKFIN